MASHAAVPPPDESHLSRGYGTSQSADVASGNPAGSPTPQRHAPIFTEDFDASQRGSSIIDGPIRRPSSRASTAAGEASVVSRSNTLKKKSSVKRSGSLKRSGSKKSLAAGSIKGLGGVDSDHGDFHHFSFTPIPTTGTPTEVLAHRFQAWRQLLKSLIGYFREIQNSYDTRAKALHKVQNSLSSFTHPAVFMSSNGLGDATQILQSYHRRSIAEAHKAREIENDVIGALTGLRSDLGQKIKEIKSLSGDFKNSVDKEKDATRKEVEKLQEALQHADHEDGGAIGRNDPYVVRLCVDRQIERQIDEENYLHRAYLNLESSGRELESIVVGEIQKAYNALAGILKREADDAYGAVESLRSGPVGMPKDQEWYQFVTHDPHFVDPSLPLRRIEEIEYPGKHHPAATEIRAGMLERKSKYLKSYTPGWYVLSPTHLHEFKSADKIYSQPPVMSLYLPDQKVGSRSDPGSSSHKFMLKGKQSGGLHKGHNWVFRAESYDTMMAWYHDIRVLTEHTGAERIAFVRKHARSVSGTSDRGTVSSDGMEEDEADKTPYSADLNSLAERSPVEKKAQRPMPGGRFPSDLALRKTGSTNPTSDGADDSSDDADVVAAAAALPGSSLHGYSAAQPRHESGLHAYGDEDPYRLDNIESATVRNEPGVSQAFPAYDERAAEPMHQKAQTTTSPVQTQTLAPANQPPQPVNQQQPHQPGQPFLGREPATASTQTQSLARPPTEVYSDWFAPVAAGAAGVGAGAVGAEPYRCHQQGADVPRSEAEIQDLGNFHAAAAAFACNSAQAPAQNTPSSVPPTLEGTHEIFANNSIPALAKTVVDDTPAGLAHPPQTVAHGVSQSDGDIVLALATASVDDGITSSPTALPRRGASPLAASSIDSRVLGEGTSSPPMVPSTYASSAQLNDAAPATVGSTDISTDIGLGGNEREGAHETGKIFPMVIKHDTDNMSISQLHIPGEFK